MHHPSRSHAGAACCTEVDDKQRARLRQPAGQSVGGLHFSDTGVEVIALVEQSLRFRLQGEDEERFGHLKPLVGTRCPCALGKARRADHCGTIRLISCPTRKTRFATPLSKTSAATIPAKLTGSFALPNWGA